eukprot:Nk52_evm10s2426 gene=Nk52_evmTU10s2426
MFKGLCSRGWWLVFFAIACVTHFVSQQTGTNRLYSTKRDNLLIEANSMDISDYNKPLKVHLTVSMKNEALYINDQLISTKQKKIIRSDVGIAFSQEKNQWRYIRNARVLLQVVKFSRKELDSDLNSLVEVGVRIYSINDSNVYHEQLSTATIMVDKFGSSTVNNINDNSRPWNLTLFASVQDGFTSAPVSFRHILGSTILMAFLVGLANIYRTLSEEVEKEDNDTDSEDDEYEMVYVLEESGESVPVAQVVEDATARMFRFTSKETYNKVSLSI